jgi:hypothetical protein
MVDIGRISSRKWAIALLVFLCVSAVLFIAPWILSVFYESDQYDFSEQNLKQRSDEAEGNSTVLWCSPGPCLACSASEKADPKLKCSPTGYHKIEQCVKDENGVPDLIKNKDDGDGHLGASEDPIEGNNQNHLGETETAGSDSSDGDDTTIKERSLVGADDVSQKILIYRTCLPQDVKEKLSVFGFEGVVLLCLLLSAPAVHYRKKRATNTQGMQRIPSTSRF